MAARPKPRQAVAAEAALRQMREELWFLRHCQRAAAGGLRRGLQHARGSKAPGDEKARWAAQELEGMRNAARNARDHARSLTRAAAAVERAAERLRRQVAQGGARR